MTPKILFQNLYFTYQSTDARSDALQFEFGIQIGRMILKTGSGENKELEADASAYLKS